MIDPSLSLLALGSTAALGLALASGAALRGWRQWLELRRDQLLAGGSGHKAGQGELGVLRARVRRLEAIADGAKT